MLSTLVPSMFHRRLLLIAFAVLFVAMMLAVQTYRLTVLRGSEFLNIAEQRLIEERWTPTVRGRILDRKGRVLATDAPGFDVYVDYSVLSGQWAYNTASREAAVAMGERWDALSPEARERAIDRVAEEKLRVLASLWDELSNASGHRDRGTGVPSRGHPQARATRRRGGEPQTASGDAC